jgi:hypothetical protein
MCLHKCKLEWFIANRYDENGFICSQGPYRAVNSARDLATLFCVHETF